MTDENKLKIVEAGALPLYVKLLSQEYHEDVQEEAVHGLRILASNCRDSIIHEPGCLDGCYLLLLLFNCTYTV